MTCPYDSTVSYNMAPRSPPRTATTSPPCPTLIDGAPLDFVGEGLVETVLVVGRVVVVGLVIVGMLVMLVTLVTPGELVERTVLVTNEVVSVGKSVLVWIVRLEAVPPSVPVGMRVSVCIEVAISVLLDSMGPWAVTPRAKTRRDATLETTENFMMGGRCCLGTGF